MTATDEALSLGEARARYFEENGFGADGGYAKRWVKLELGRVPFWIPNTAARVRAVRRHDLHHVLTGYSTTPTGEAEIGAWEIASGCGRYTAAWILNLWALSYGLWLAPRAVWRAFQRGRRCRNLYHAELDDAVLERPVAHLRAALAIPRDDVAPRAGDVLAFAGWSAAAALWGLVTLALVLAPLAAAIYALL